MHSVVHVLLNLGGICIWLACLLLKALVVLINQLFVHFASLAVFSLQVLLVLVGGLRKFLLFELLVTDVIKLLQDIDKH